MASRTQSFTSVTTWSLRLRPVCSLRPTSPSFAISARSMCVWMSSSAMENSISPRVDLGADLVERRDDLLGLVGGEQADLGEHPGVGLAGADVVRDRAGGRS